LALYLTLFFSIFISLLVCLFFLFFFYSSVDHRDLHSFPTRRSSDLRPTSRLRAPSVRAQLRLRIHARFCARLPAGARFQTRLKSDRKSTRLNSSHDQISYAVFCLKKKKTQKCTLHYITQIIYIRNLA